MLSCYASAQNKQPKFNDPLNILVFTKTNGWRHESISSGMKMLYDNSASQNWVITASEDSLIFTNNVLQRMDVIIFLNPSQNVLGKKERKAFEKFMKKGKGFIGIHAAADCGYDWPFYGNLVGGYFLTHPATQEATVTFEHHNHPAMEPFEGMKTYTTIDEWYTFKENPREKVNVLACLDESTINAKGDEWRMYDHPIIWWKEENGIRSFYTGFGHTHESFQDQLIIEHITNAINWAGRRIN